MTSHYIIHKPFHLGRSIEICDELSIFSLEEKRCILIQIHLPYECQNCNEKCLKWLLVWYLWHMMLIRDSPWVWLHQSCGILLCVCVRSPGQKIPSVCMTTGMSYFAAVSIMSPRLSSVWFFPLYMLLFSATPTPLDGDREICKWMLSWRVLRITG